MDTLKGLSLLLIFLLCISNSQIISIDDEDAAFVSSGNLRGATLPGTTSLPPPPQPSAPPAPSTLLPPPPPPTSTDPYLQLRNWTRSYDGTGNNAKNTNWGSAGQPQSRFCASNYGTDNAMISGPNPRELSNSLGDASAGITLSRPNWNMLFPIWGQFVQHDIALTSSSSTESIPIAIPKCDQTFDKTCTGTQSFPFNRDAYTLSTNGTRTQINLSTAWLDGSGVYGTSKSLADSLRTFTNGKLKTSAQNLLPKSISGFFTAGDVRANENIGLIALHTVFMREHNRLCDVFLAKNPKLTDEQLYQMARNYVIGLIQHITMDQYLLLLLGKTQFDAWVGNYTYQESVNPDLYTEFNSAAFRIGHSMINSPYKFMDNSGTVLKNLTLGEMFQNPNLVTNETLSQILNGLLRINSKQRSLEMVDDLRNFLSISFMGTMKMDLFAINVQRGRDHGVCSYQKARDTMNMAAQNWTEMFGQAARKLQNSYSNDTNKIDLWVGIIGQRSIPGSDLGQLGGKLVAAQFKKIRNGDKYWYENVMTGGLLKEVRTTSLADVIRRNTNVTTFDARVFVKVA